MKKNLNMFIVLLSLFSGIAWAGDDLKTFLGVDVNTPFVPQFYENATEIEGRKDAYRVQIKDGNIFETSKVIRGEQGFPFIVESCTDRASIDQVTSVLNYKYESYPNYRRFHYDPFSDDYRIGFAILGSYEMKVFRADDEGSKDKISKTCVRLMNRSKPNYEWLSERYELPLDLYIEL